MTKCVTFTLEELQMLCECIGEMLNNINEIDDIMFPTFIHEEQLASMDEMIIQLRDKAEKISRHLNTKSKKQGNLAN